MARTNLVVKHIRSNARTVQNGTVIKTPTEGTIPGLYYGEIGLNANVIDPTLFIPVVTNTEVTDVASISLITTLAQFKSLGWLQTNVMGTTDVTAIRTLKYITDALDILTADGDAVIDSWNEIKAFLFTLPADDSYTMMSLIGSKASVNYTLGIPQTSDTKTINIVSITGTGSIATVTFTTLTEEPFEIGSHITIVGASVAGYNNSVFIDGSNPVAYDGANPYWTVISCTLSLATFACTATGTASALGTVKGSQIPIGAIKLYDDVTLKTTLTPGGANPDYSILKVDLTAGIIKGLWAEGVWTPGSVYARTQLSTDKAIDATLVQNFYNEFSYMFELQSTPSRILANMDFYSLGEVSAYGAGTGGGGGGGAVTNLYISSGLSTTLADFTDDALSAQAFNAYTVNAIHNRVLALEAGNAGGVTLDALVTGFTITGGTTTAKTLTVLQTLTLNGNAGTTLNIGAGGTLGSAAFLATTAFAPAVGSTGVYVLGTVTTGTWNATTISPVYGGTGISNNVNYTISLGGGIETHGDFDLMGVFSTTMNVTATTNITLPTTGTVLSTDSIIDCGTF